MYYFGSGPATMPEEVLAEISGKILRKGGRELSVLEIPHRGRLFQEMVQESEALVKSLLNLEDDYEICWMHGGGRTQFAQIPMNFLAAEDTAGFIDTGRWSSEARDYAGFYGKTLTLASSKESNYREIPSWPDIPDDLTYLYLTTNNTIYGTQFKHFPETKVPLVVDMTSELFSRELDYNRFAFIFAAAQKNIGPAGITLVIARKSFLEKQKNLVPGIFSYRDLFKNHSTYNTPPVFALFSSLIYLRWTARVGMETIAARNRAKAAMLYQFIDSSKVFKCPVDKESRSEMNVCIYMKSPEQQEAFIDFAARAGIKGIRGHRSAGGLRIALYNAISEPAVEYLIDTMNQFENQ